MISAFLVLLGCALALCESARPASPPPLVDFTQYFPATPGMVYDFRSLNHRTGTIGQTRIELEAETDWCGLRVRPWRFTKSATDLYWAPGLDLDLRWLLVAPDEVNVPVAAWTRMVWAMGDQRFVRGTLLAIGTTPAYRVVYRSMSGYPPYLLAMKTGALPVETHDDTGQNYLVPAAVNPCPQLQLPFREGPVTVTPAGPSISYGWRMRMDHAQVVVPAMSYTGPALRVDYWEGSPGVLETMAGVLRESWYYVRYLGLVEIRGKQFGLGTTSACLADPDCLQSDMVSPDTTMTLEKVSSRVPRGLGE